MTSPHLSDQDAILLISHGTVHHLDELPEFLTHVRRGHPPSPELLHEIRFRYEQIGGKSPLNEINDTLAHKLGNKLGIQAKACNRLARPYPQDRLSTWIEDGIKRVFVLPLAQYSAPIYKEAVEKAQRELGSSMTMVYASNWGHRPDLIAAFSKRLSATLRTLPKEELAYTSIILSAHSLPVSVIQSGDPYEKEFRYTATEVIKAISPLSIPWHISFQSQGLSTGPRPIEWLGPDFPTILDKIAKDNMRHVILAPIGFLADHVEILYDIDIEAQNLAKARNLTLHRTPSLNAEDDLVDIFETMILELT